MTSMTLNDVTPGKRIKFKLIENIAEGGTEVEGHVDIVAPDGSAIVIKQRGHTMTRLVEASAIIPNSIELVHEAPKELKSKRLDPLSPANARQHLLDRHEFQLDVVNRLSDEAALNEHDLIDHGKLGHFHATLPVEEATV